MTFLNWLMLAGLGLGAIPILLHLASRSRPQTIDWGAMQFLREVLAHQRRRVRLEEWLLLLLRCFWLMLLAVALARPLLPHRRTVPWQVVLPLVVLIALCMLAFARASASRRRGVVFLLAGVLLLAAVVGAVAWEYAQQKDIWTLPAESRDLAIVIDASTSMQAGRDGASNFAQAVDEARLAVDSLRPGDAAEIILAGPAPVPLGDGPTADHDTLRANLDTIEPIGGSANLPDALQAAAESLQRSGRAVRQILLLTDGQRLGWLVEDEGAWSRVGRALAPTDRPIPVLCRTLGLAEQPANLACATMRPSRRVVGVDRPVRIDVTVTNTGSVAMEPTGVDLRIDGQRQSRRTVRLEPGASETVQFQHRFREPGLYAAVGEVAGADDIPADNRLALAIPVLRSVPVLILDGAPSNEPMGGAGAFIDVALRPEPGKTTPQENAPDMDDLFTPVVRPAADISPDEPFGEYGVVVLADVPRLPQHTAQALARYVRQGGGLLLAAGAECDPAFYHQWADSNGRSVLPGRLVRRVAHPDDPQRLAVRGIAHPSLAELFADRSMDLDRAMVHARWQLQLPDGDPDVSVGVLFEDDSPALLERSLGEGTVAMLAFGLGREDSNLTRLDCFPPLIHAIVHDLAASQAPELNLQPGETLAVEIPRDTQPDLPWPAPGSTVLDVLLPSQQRAEAAADITTTGLAVRFDHTRQPGLYRVLLRPDLQRSVAGGSGSIPFTVSSNVEESVLRPLSSSDRRWLQRRVAMTPLNSPAELTAALTGQIPGRELWRYLAVGVLLCVVGELVMSRWITRRRGQASAGFDTAAGDGAGKSQARRPLPQAGWRP